MAGSVSDKTQEANVVRRPTQRHFNMQHIARHRMERGEEREGEGEREREREICFQFAQGPRSSLFSLKRQPSSCILTSNPLSTSPLHPSLTGRIRVDSKLVGGGICWKDIAKYNLPSNLLLLSSSGTPITTSD